MVRRRRGCRPATVSSPFVRSVWPVVISALFRALQPAVVIDIGGEPERISALVNAFAAGGEVHVVDGPDGLLAGAPGVRVLSADVDTLPASDLALIDGEPSWDAVNNALDAVSAAAEQAGRPLPVIVVGGVDWPHGRRDGYHDAERARHEIAAGGLAPGAAEPDPALPVGEVAFARTEGGPRNGVRTAVEDFAAQQPTPLTVVHLPGDGGVLLLAAPEEGSVTPTPQERAVLSLAPSADLLALLAALEQDRLHEHSRAEVLAHDSGAAFAGAAVTVLAARLEETRHELRVAIEARLDAEERLARAVAAASEPPASVGLSASGTTGESADGETVAEQAFRTRYAMAWEPDERDLDEGTRGTALPCDVGEVLVSGAGTSVCIKADGTGPELDRCVAAVLDHADRPIQLSVDCTAAGDEVTARAARLALRLGIEIGPVEAAEVQLSSHSIVGPGFLHLGEGEQAPAIIDTDLSGPRAAGPLASVAFILPGVSPGVGGGVHSVAQEAVALSGLGVDVRVLVGGGGADRLAQAHPSVARLIVGTAGPDDIRTALEGVDIAVATEYSTVADVQAAHEARPELVAAYYVQDYEPFFAPAGSERADDALLSYGRLDGIVLFAKTEWLRNVVQRMHGVRVYKVAPSLDSAIFHPGPARRDDIVRVAAMVRPRSPRRRPVATRRLLERLVAEGGGRVQAVAFGCSDEELQALDPAPVRAIQSAGVLDRNAVADLLRGSDVFVDLSVYQAFGRTGLEAMACGAVPVLPRIGGVREYARDGENAVLLDTADVVGRVAAVTDLVASPERRRRLRAAGEVDALAFSSTRTAISEYLCWTRGPARAVHAR